MYIPLTVHSAYSLQEGLALPAELVQAAAADGIPALGLTDHRLLIRNGGIRERLQKGGSAACAGA